MIESSWTFKPLTQYEPSDIPLPIDWALAMRAFDDYMCAFESDVPHATSSQAVAGLFGNAGQLLRSWARKRSAQLLEPPSANALLDGATQLWPELQNSGDTIFVIPSLERCFLRHFRGTRWRGKLCSTWR